MVENIIFGLAGYLIGVLMALNWTVKMGAHRWPVARRPVSEQEPRHD